MSLDEVRTVARYESITRRRIAESWSLEQERILKVWGEKASGWAWLHDKASRYYKRIDNYYVYPTIVLSSISGGIGFIMMGDKSADPADLASPVQLSALFVSAAHIINVILTSFQKFQRSGEKAEMHVQIAKQFSSFTRKIVLELSIPPSDRKDCLDFCNGCKEEYDKLILDSPMIPDEIIKDFNATFKYVENKPEVTNGLVHFTDWQFDNGGLSDDGIMEIGVVPSPSQSEWKRIRLTKVIEDSPPRRKIPQSDISSA
jgi:hypothetical protein